MTFEECNNMEKVFFNDVFAPYCFNKKVSVSWISDIKEQKRDKDVVMFIDGKTIYFSIKVVRDVFKYIFFETISNVNKNTNGWAIYCEADYILYAMLNKNINYLTYIIKRNSNEYIDVLNKIHTYKKGYGTTYSRDGEILYKTEGVLVPPIDFNPIVTNVLIPKSIYKPCETCV